MNCAPLRAFVCRFVSTVTLLVLVSIASSAQTYIFGRADFPVDNSPNALASGDFNGDGVIDVAVTNSYDNTVSILLDRPDATFAPQVAYPTGSLPVAIVAGNFNGDGNLDLAVTYGDARRPTSPSLRHVAPAGTYTTTVTAVSGSNTSNTALTVLVQ